MRNRGFWQFGMGFVIAIGVLLSMLSGTAIAAANEMPASASVDRRSMTIGDSINLTVTAFPRKDAEIRFPPFSDNKIGDFEIRSRGSAEKRSLWGARKVTSRYTITIFKTGKQLIPPVDVGYKTKADKEWHTVRTRPIEITVQSVLPRSSVPPDIRDITGPVAYFDIPWTLLASLCIALMCIGGISWYLIQRARRLPVRLPHETALEELEALKGFLMQGGDVKEFFVRISDCIRSYIERSFRVKAPEMTTEEFLYSVKVSDALTLDQKDLLKEFLGACDLVKFARYHPSGDEVERVLAAARTFIEGTHQMLESA